MAQTEQAWDWGVELRDEERDELELLRGTVAELRAELARTDEALKICRHRHREASEALSELALTGLWRRRRVLTALRERRLL
jgi:hypothetical protein